MSNRSVTFTGIQFENPFLLSSAPPTESESNILRAFEAGWAGVVTKTIGLHPVVNVVGAKAKFMRTSPEDAYVSMKKRPGAALHSSWNWELISDKTLDWWVPRIRRIKEAFPIASSSRRSWPGPETTRSSRTGSGSRGTVRTPAPTGSSSTFPVRIWTAGTWARTSARIRVSVPW